MKWLATSAWMFFLSLAAVPAVAGGDGQSTTDSSDDVAPVLRWEVFDLAELEGTRQGQHYREFLNVPSMTAGLFVLGRDADDGQSAHDRDELYHVISGKATLRIAGADHPVGPGSVVFVRQGVEHRFHSIADELHVLVLFAGRKS